MAPSWPTFQSICKLPLWCHRPIMAFGIGCLHGAIMANFQSIGKLPPQRHHSIMAFGIGHLYGAIMANWITWIIQPQVFDKSIKLLGSTRRTNYCCQKLYPPSIYTINEKGKSKQTMKHFQVFIGVWPIQCISQSFVDHRICARQTSTSTLCKKRRLAS